MKNWKSIVQKDDSCCFICGCNRTDHTHHIMHGTSNRKNADKWNLVVKLCEPCHTKVHRSRVTDLMLICLGQKKFEELYGHSKWMEVFGKNYL